MNVEGRRPISGVEKALIFLNGAEEKNDSVLHEGESLACFPVAENGMSVDLMLSLGENTND
jgi:phage-related protein